MATMDKIAHSMEATAPGVPPYGPKAYTKAAKVAANPNACAIRKAVLSMDGGTGGFGLSTLWEQIWTSEFLIATVIACISYLSRTRSANDECGNSNEIWRFVYGITLRRGGKSGSSSSFLAIVAKVLARTTLQPFASADHAAQLQLRLPVDNPCHKK